MLVVLSSMHLRSALLVVFALFALPAVPAPVQLQNSTATFSQGALDGVGPYSPGQAIDGLFDFMGWTIDHFPNNDPSQEFTQNETAVWETASDIGPGQISVTMHFLHWNPGHLLGRFRFSVTADDRSTYADGLPEGGDVDANWTVLAGLLVEGPAGMTLPRSTTIASSPGASFLARVSIT